MTASAFEHWLQRYGKAWESGSPEDALCLFSTDAKYFETPFDPPMVGHGAIREYWTEGAKNSQTDIRFTAQPISYDGRIGYALWHASFVRAASGVRVELDGVLSAQFDSQMQCVVFKEWWHRRETDGNTVNPRA